jgi:regulator of sigma E protease
MSEIFSHPIPAVLVLLGALVFFHELGHFLVGRFCGIAVEIFSIGFGPRLFGFTRNGTDFRISGIPLGGFVKFAGAHPSEEVPDGLNGIPFRDASLIKRAATVAAGPIANFILAIFVFAWMGMDGIKRPPALIGDVIPGSAAEQAGIQFGDRFVKIDDHAIKSWRDLEQIISKSPGKQIAVTVEREGGEKVIELTPAVIETQDIAGRKVTIGRAGITLGRMPATVSVYEPGTVADAAGLKTGDLVKTISWNSVSKEVIHFPLLARLFGEAVRDPNAQQVTLTVEDKFPVDGKIPEQGPERTLTLDISSLKQHKDRTDKELLDMAGIHDSQMTVLESTETAAGVLKPGDRILGFAGEPLPHLIALTEKLNTNTNQIVRFQIARDKVVRDLDVTLKPIEVQKPEGKVTVYMLPVSFMATPQIPDPIVEQYSNPLTAIAFGMRHTGEETMEQLRNLGSLVSGDIPIKALGGPILIAMVAGDSAKQGLQTFLNSLALISINLGLLNLFPIPVLDGGQLVMMGVEGVRRRPLREAAIENFQKVGFAMIMALVVLAMYNDFSRFWKSMLESIIGLFQ